MSKRWSYLVIEVKTSLLGSIKQDSLQTELDKHGKLGWELVNIIHSTPTITTPTLIFKKEQ